jgi:hypothetical protein
VALVLVLVEDRLLELASSSALNGWPLRSLARA